MTTPEPGWYQDPSHPGSHRWWDGSAWTDQVLSNAPIGNGLSAPGDWFSEAVRLARARAGHLFTIVVLFSLPATIIAGILTWLAIDGASLENFGPDADGFPRAVGFTGVGALYGLGSILVTALASSLAVAAMTHQIASNEAADAAERAFIGRQAPTADDQRYRSEDDVVVDTCPWSDSIGFVLRRPFRVLGAFLGPITAILVLWFVALVAAVIAPPLAVLFLGVLVASVLIVVRFSLGVTAAAIGPKEDNSLKVSSRLTTGIVGSVLGRLALLVLAAFTVQIFSAFLTAPITSAFGNEGLQPGVTEIALQELVGGNPAAYLAGRVVGSIVSGMTLALTAAGLFIVYRDRSGSLDPMLSETHGRAITLGPVR